MIQQATIHKLPLLVGCKSFERNHTGQMLIDIISRFVEAEFPHIDDFKLVTAFQKAASGTLNLNNKPLALSTYGQQLSPKVVGEVLRAFIQTQRTKAAEPAFQPKQLEAPSNPIDAQFMYDWTINYIQQFGRMVTQNLLPTPTSDDNPQKNTGKRNQDGLQKRAYQTTGKTSQLNPRFVAEMMGFPTDWTILPFLNGETKA